MKRNPPKIGIIWEQQTDDEANQRLLAAFELLFADVQVGIPEDFRHLTEKEERLS